MMVEVDEEIIEPYGVVKSCFFFTRRKELSRKKEPDKRLVERHGKKQFQAIPTMLLSLMRGVVRNR